MSIQIWSRKIQRFWRRSSMQYHAVRALQKENKLDPGRIRDRILMHLFQEAAAGLQLDFSPVGERIFCICGRARKFHFYADATDFDRVPLWKLAGDKLYTRALFQQHGLPVPIGCGFDRDAVGPAVEFARSLRQSCVVKPAADTATGTGVTINVQGDRQFRKAFDLAGLYSEKVLVEQQIPGDSYRFLIFRGRCLSVIRRDLPAVYGSGRHTVRQLVTDENVNRIRSSNWKPGDTLLMPLQLSRKAGCVLAKQGLGWDSVPAKGRQVVLTELANTRVGGLFCEVLEQAHPDLIRTAQKAAEAAELELAGVDLMAENVSAAKHHILEINTTPGLTIHYIIRNTEQCRNPIRTILAGYFEIPEPVNAL
jgi:cyanophycin synthetase